MYCSHRKSTFTTKKKIKKKLKTQTQNANHPDPNATLVSDYYYYVNSSKVFTNENDTN